MVTRVTRKPVNDSVELFDTEHSLGAQGHAANASPQLPSAMNPTTQKESAYKMSPVHQHASPQDNTDGVTSIPQTPSGRSASDWDSSDEEKGLEEKEEEEEEEPYKHTTSSPWEAGSELPARNVNETCVPSPTALASQPGRSDMNSREALSSARTTQTETERPALRTEVPSQSPSKTASEMPQSSNSGKAKLKSKNPFLRGARSEQTQANMDSSALAWNDGRNVLPIRSIPRKALSQVSQDWANGEMADSYHASSTPTTYISRGAASPIPVIPPPQDNPWASSEVVTTTEHRQKTAPSFAQEPHSVWTDWPVDQSASVPVMATRPVPTVQDEAPPELPVRPSPVVEDQPPPKPPRPNVNVLLATEPRTSSAANISNLKDHRQRSEFYQIKHIRWRDINSTQALRRSPILIQNANGPCPLLALVNALVLSTPPSLKTALIETLRTREQVSLGLLLDAVFDELMSGRRGGTAHQLPDVSELYSFLVTLHTGMNVNPCFVPTHPQATPVATEPSQHVEPGSFEDTREMRLYSTFSVPLLHGWLPEKESLEYSAFSRSAPTYEDAQNVQFREEELLQKQRTEELSFEEQTLLGDLANIKEFFISWPTQLTAYGLTVIHESIKPGQVAILFRNDHFSTLYHEPRTGQLMALVTDAGYATHDEIVWESLSDINGTYSELYAGDFRSVSHEAAGDSRVNLVASEVADDGEWTTVESRNSHHQRKKGATNSKAAVPGQAGKRTSAEALHDSRHASPITSHDSPSNTHLSQPVQVTRTVSEQEDHDLALALQLQEEEEQNSRAGQEARQRENELSQQFLSQEQSRRGSQPLAQPSPIIPPRRSNQNNSTWRPPEQSDDDEALPTYEQAAASKPYVPPVDHPLSAHVPRQRQSLYAQQSALNAGSPSQGPQVVSRRLRPSARQSLIEHIPPHVAVADHRGSRNTAAGYCDDEEDKCAVM